MMPLDCYFVFHPDYDLDLCAYLIATFLQMVEDLARTGVLFADKGGMVVTRPEALRQLAPGEERIVTISMINSSTAHPRTLLGVSQLVPITQV